MVENAVIESLKTRRAVRGYADRPVEREKLDAILEAATYAPTGMGAQSPVIVLVESKEVRDKVAALNAGVMGRDIDPFYGAPAVAIVFGHRGCCAYLVRRCLSCGGQPSECGACRRGRLVLHLSCQGGLRDRRGSSAFEGLGSRRRLRGRCQLYPGLRRRPCARAEASQGRVREDRLVGERWGSVPRGERVVMFKSPFSRWCEASCSIDV